MNTPEEINLIDQREAHYEKFLGPIPDEVMDSTDIKPVHIDIYTFPPTTERPYYTVVTGGMSDLRQNIPDRYDSLAKRAEIITYTREEPQGWLYNVLKGLAEAPFDHDTFFHWYHNVPNGKPMTAVPSLLTAYLFLPPYLEVEDFSPMTVDGDETDFLMMVPITDAELKFIREHRVNAMLDVFDKHDFDYIIEEQRRSFV